jgi:predicted Zn-dependent protease
MIRKLSAAAVALTLASFVGVACAKVPFTGRKQFNVIPTGVMNAIGQQSFQETISESKIVKQGEDAELTKEVGKRIAKSANQPDFKWRYALIKDDTINAWCLPGGKIGVYSGILPVFENEAGMSFVMGHEVGHAIAQHGGERLSQQLVLMGGLAGINAWLSGSSKLSEQQRNMLMSAIGLGAEVGVSLPFSRAQESEADVIGIMLMSKAGYPPAESIAIWDRMDKATGGQSTPAFLSDHPSNANRQENLREWMPKAKKRYERNKQSRDTLKKIWG